MMYFILIVKCLQKQGDNTKWFDKWAKIREQISYYRKQEREERLEEQIRQKKLRAERNELRIKQKICRDQIQAFRRLRSGTDINTGAEEEIELLNKIFKLKTEERELRLKRYRNQHHGGREDFEQYYKHIYRTRPLILILNLAFWFLLFWFGGVGIGLKIAILIFALATTAGSLYELAFSVKVKARILRPVEKLVEGVSEIAKGNYNVSVCIDAPSEISSLITAFNEMARKLGESERLKAEYEENRKALIANISHDLKTPITSIQGYIEVLTSGENISPEKTETYLNVILNNTTYMNRLIDDLFLFAKLDMQKLDFHFDELKVSPLIDDMMEEFKLDLQEKELSFEFVNALACNPTVKLDAKRFYQVIHNMIDNSVKYGSKEKLEIKSKLYEADGFVCLDISDNGPGISEGNLPHIFERFYRADAVRTKDLSSTGLGLAIARELIHAHGGEITVLSRLAEGTCFTISIPCREEV